MTDTDTNLTLNIEPIDWGRFLVPGYADASVLRWLANMEAVQVSGPRNLIASLPLDVQRDLRLRAIHSLPRSAILTMDDQTLALYHSEVALELARLHIDLSRESPARS